MGKGYNAKRAEAWGHYMEAERQDLENRRNGLLRKLLDGPLPGESPEELEQLASEDETRAAEGFVELLSPDGEIYYKYIDALSPEDRSDRIAAEGARVEWITERTRTRRLSLSFRELELAPIGWKLFILGNSPPDQVAASLAVDKFDTRLLAQALSRFRPLRLRPLLCS
ncbi:MAG: hypothetical protein QOI57_1294 [Rubrobacteraceae bacterium]|jgi:hypothetical protein|nr:hypothetical protein [Rubrobacteraceae bacterium]